MPHSIPKPVESLRFFSRFREELYYTSARFESPWGMEVPIIYTDSTAMGLPMRSIEGRIRSLVETADLSNIHERYHESLERVKRYVNAGDRYEILPAGTGCTAAMNILTRDILGFRSPDYWDRSVIEQTIPENEKPFLITTMMEHHSSDLVLRECVYKELFHIGFDDRGLPDFDALENVLESIRTKFENPILITCTAGSNVTGIKPDLCRAVEIAHRFDALIALDFAAAGPYSSLDLQGCGADAYGLSPHKFPGGPQTCGLLCLDRDLLGSQYNPVIPGPSTMIELIRVAEVMDLKKSMDIERIRSVVTYYAHEALDRLSTLDNVEIIGRMDLERFAIISFVVRSPFSSNNPPPDELKAYLLAHPPSGSNQVFYVHHNLIATLLNDRYGIQVRPGCSCAGPYGHWLLQIGDDESRYHRDRIDRRLLDQKPGWVRITFNELNSSEEFETVVKAVKDVSAHWNEYCGKYSQDMSTGEFSHISSEHIHVGITEWQELMDPEDALYSPAIEEFMEKQILPFAANTHTEINHTGTTCTLWYHWAQRIIRTATGVDDSYALRFIRAGYDPLRVLLFYLGIELPARMEAKYRFSRILDSRKRKNIYILGDTPDFQPGSVFADLAHFDDFPTFRSAVEHAPENSIILAGFGYSLKNDELTFISRVSRGTDITCIIDTTELLGTGALGLQSSGIHGCVIRTERLPGGLQTHPVILLQESRFENAIALDIGGGIVDWTTVDQQQYVSDRTVLEDAGTPGIFQGIRSGIVIGRCAASLR